MGTKISKGLVLTAKVGPGDHFGGRPIIFIVTDPTSKDVITISGHLCMH